MTAFCDIAAPLVWSTHLAYAPCDMLSELELRNLEMGKGTLCPETATCLENAGFVVVELPKGFLQAVDSLVVMEKALSDENKLRDGTQGAKDVVRYRAYCHGRK